MPILTPNLTILFLNTFSDGALTISGGSLFQVFAALSRRKSFITHQLVLEFQILCLCPLISFGYISTLMYDVFVVYNPDKSLYISVMSHYVHLQNKHGRLRSLRLSSQGGSQSLGTILVALLWTLLVKCSECSSSPGEMPHAYVGIARFISFQTEQGGRE